MQENGVSCKNGQYTMFWGKSHSYWIVLYEKEKQKEFCQESIFVRLESASTAAKNIVHISNMKYVLTYLW